MANWLDRYYPGMSDNLPGGDASTTYYSFEMADCMRRRGLMSRDMFVKLGEEFPAQLEAINIVMQKCLGNVPPLTEREAI